MNKISSALLALSLMISASLTFAMEPMDMNGAMEKGAMSKDGIKHEDMTKESMNKEGAMMKAQPKKMKKQSGTMEQGGKMEHSGSMAMKPKK
jgi:hypothetical protein